MLRIKIIPWGVFTNSDLNHRWKQKESNHFTIFKP